MSVSSHPDGPRPRPVVANWKMYGTRETLVSWARGLEERLAAAPCPGPVVACPPAPYLLLFSAYARFDLGAQDVADEEDGAYTGCVSAAMLRDCGCRYVIVGHSERRCLQGEGDALIARKVLRALAAGLRPILCLGESLDERDAGRTEEVLLRELGAVLEVLGPPGAEPPELLLAYEPLWAIGSGRPARAEDVASAHALLRRRLGEHDAKMSRRTPILYGGSVRAPQARELRTLEDVDGLLVGGASRNVEEFHTICRAWHDQDRPQD